MWFSKGEQEMSDKIKNTKIITATNRSNHVDVRHTRAASRSAEMVE